ncbi:MAG: hypothetical protein AYP45_10800 [Candidatus Brocadia carolinensis]|uniref:Uncharacterized protein n=1 Tax=Candidatus Brocadia carolinensis TaxID=1004156 RepID=A0A1V4ASQ5_9BACT|nr:MAG: hypothetical protein AYP45_10800 [Candidatus Brocadia caroliniensis]
MHEREIKIVKRFKSLVSQKVKVHEVRVFSSRANVCASILNLIIEVTGERKEEKEAKVATARDLCVPAVSNHGGFGAWALLEIRDPWNAKTEIRNTINTVLGNVKTLP